MRSLVAEKAAHAALRDVGWSVSPRLEQTAADLMILDIAGLSSLLGSEAKIAELLTTRTAECGLRVCVAISENPLVAEVTARGFSGITIVAAGEEVRRIGELPIAVLSPPVEIAETLELWGIRTCAALARLPILQLSERLGQAGVRLHALARGTATRALAVAEAELTFEEELELDDAVEDLEPLSFVLGRLLAQLCARLTARGLSASVLHVRFDLQPAFENALDVHTEVVRAKSSPGMYELSMQLPVPLRDSKLLLKLLRLRLQTSPPRAAVVKVLLGAEAANPRVTQRGLFVPSFPEAEKLELTLARLVGVVGEDNVGSAEVVDTHRPDSFRMRRFAPEREEATDAAKKKAKKKRKLKTATKSCEQKHLALSLRIFRPPLPIHVNAPEGRPAEVFLLGGWAEVRKASGPWRTSGEWWSENPWAEDEWDLEVSFISKDKIRKVTPFFQECGRYRIYFDTVRQSWFARGTYD
jgi:protein ImuB